jgi:hypothetical protein
MAKRTFDRDRCRRDSSSLVRGSACRGGHLIVGRGAKDGAQVPGPAVDAALVPGGPAVAEAVLTGQGAEGFPQLVYTRSTPSQHLPANLQPCSRQLVVAEGQL